MKPRKNKPEAERKPNISFTNIFAHGTQYLIDLATQYLFLASEKAELALPESRVRSFVQEVSENYYRNQYHSFHHGIDVMFSFDKFVSLSPVSTTPMDRFFLSIIALNHDVLHPGCSNRCLITRNSMLPITVNSISVNEKVSVDMCKALILKTKLFENITQKHKDEFEITLHALLIATDIESSAFDTIIERNIENNKLKKTSYDSYNSIVDKDIDTKNLLLGVLLRISDVGNCLFSFEECVNWGYRLYLEVSGKKLKKCELENNFVDAFKNQAGFLRGYITNLIVNAFKLGALRKDVYDDLARNLVKLIEEFEQDFGNENINTKQLLNKYEAIIYWRGCNN